MPAPAPLAENLPFAFRGEEVERARTLDPPAARLLLAARNPTGKPNADVLREFIGVASDGDEVRRWALDFPAEMSPAEARLYVSPFSLCEKTRVLPVSPGRHPDLRNALARVERFLAAPAAEPVPDFAWIEGEVLPDASLVVWARDDDFSAALLGSRAFALWAAAGGDLQAALHSFPFPWPPGTPLNSLSREQEESRFDLSRAARSEDLETIEAASARAYGWSGELDDEEVLGRLRALHATRPPAARQEPRGPQGFSPTNFQAGR